MCTISVEVNEKMLRSLNPNLDSTAAISQWVQQLVNYHTQLMVDNNGEATDMKFSHDMTPEAYERMSKAVNPYGDANTCDKIGRALKAAN